MTHDRTSSTKLRFRMRRLLVNLVVFLGSAAIGLLMAAVVLDNFSITATSFIVDVVIFAVLQLVLSRLIPRHLVLGAVGLASTFVATAYEPDIQRSRDQGGGDLDPRNSDRVGCDDARDLGTIALDTTEPGCASPDPLVCR